MDYSFDDVDELFLEAVDICCKADKASASFLQKKMDIGYARAARLIDELERFNVVSGTTGNKPRRVLITDPREFSFGKASLEKRKRDSLKDKVVPEWANKKFTDNIPSVDVFVGLDKKKTIILPISDLAHVYIYSGSLGNHTNFLKTTIDQLINKYDPDTVKLIIGDETKSLEYINGDSHLLTPVMSDYQKLANALGWVVAEIERRQNLRSEIGDKNFHKLFTNTRPATPRIIILLNFPSGLLEVIAGNIIYKLDRLLSLGHPLGIHLYIVSNLNDRKLTKRLATIPTKIIFKTHSTIDADILGTDDAFDLKDKNEYIFIPPYGKVEKLRLVEK